MLFYTMPAAAVDAAHSGTVAFVVAASHMRITTQVRPTDQRTATETRYSLSRLN